MKKLHLAIDCSSFMWRSLLWGKDGENGYTVKHNDKDVHINSCHYGYDNVMDELLKVIDEFKVNPIDCIFVFEGKNSKGKRQMISKDYKSGDSRPDAAYEEFNKLKVMLQTTWRDLGAQLMWQDFAEGDDTLAWLAKHTEEDMVIATFDNDLTALNQINAQGADVRVWIDGLTACNKYGVFDFHLVTTYKALVGDTSDKIKGCPGFGPAAFEKLVEQYGFDGLQELHDMLLKGDLGPLAELAEDPDNKILKKIWDNAPSVLQSFDLARLRPEWVHTLQHPINWVVGMVRQIKPSDEPRLRKWYGKSRLINGENFDDAVAWAAPHIAASREVALDIETSSTDESDAWALAQGNEDKVDTYGSTLTGLGLTFGPNNQYSLYFDVDHANPDPDYVHVDSEKLRQFVNTIPCPKVIHNTAFELPVLFNEWGAQQMDNGCHGFLTNVLDSMLEASYVDENNPRGLKQRSATVLDYQQQTYEQTTKLTAHPSELPKGGKLVHQTYEERTVGTGKFSLELVDGVPTDVEITKTEKVMVGTGVFEDVQVALKGKELKAAQAAGQPEFRMEQQEVMTPVVATETRQYKMNELTAQHVLGYGLDDPICTISLHNYFKLHMQLEHHWHVYLQVELDAAYQHAKNFIDGCDISIEKLKELDAEDTITYDKSWAVVREYLIEKGWEGVAPPVYTAEITAAEAKEAFEIVTGRKLDTAMRTLSKLVVFAREVENEPIFAGKLEELLAGDVEAFNKYIQSFYDGEPKFNDGSTKQMQHLMYEVMGLPVRVRNKPTEIMRKAGIREGSPKTDNLAIAYALQECGEREKEVLESLKLMAMVGTRRSLYYHKYPYFPHWKDGKVRSSHNQSSTNTRRASESGPNKQQLPKLAKIDGYEARFREVLVPHKPDAVIVSMDFEGQEMVLIAEMSRDEMLMSCFIGENKRKMHIITGLGIMKLDAASLKSLDIHKSDNREWTYEYMATARKDEKHPDNIAAEKGYQLGKKVNFTTEFGAMAPKLAQTMMVSEDLAQGFIEAREAMFPRVAEWKVEEIKQSRKVGYVKTLMGAVRHLRNAYVEGDHWEASKAERQAVNFRVQGSAAEQTKLAEGRMWKAELAYKYDAVCIGPVHDELIWSVAIKDLQKFIPEMHACMVGDYAGISIPIESSISFGKDLYNQIEIGTKPTLEAIEAGLKTLQDLKS